MILQRYLPSKARNILLGSSNMLPTIIIPSRFASTAMQSPGKLSRLNGKVAIVTGSTMGIGFHIARRMAQEGASVVVSSRKQTNVDMAVKQLRSEGLEKICGAVCHVAKEEDRQHLVNQALLEFGKLDILVCNAAVNPYVGKTLDTLESVWDKVFEVNVKSAFMLTKLAVPHMEIQGKGAILYVSSFVAYSPQPLIGPYSVSKTALLSLTKVMAMECADKNIRVNCIAPGVVETEFAKKIVQNKELVEYSLALVMMKRFGKPQEMSALATFLCSDDASYITGEVVRADGGTNARL